ncbi:Tol-Pal system beta propeller repeat protein TolB [Salinispirillum sp. LH 10-3-1]|uniref:Tol-Pal system protein TolB n=1 Tax=Salinispirillum sp. LH 10-3-1 TaxID=2952525 RepID=A0AB38YD81_9GAMM
MRRLLFVLLSLALVQPAMAQLTITVTKGYDDKTNIAVVPFLWDGDGAAPSEMTDIVIANLERTGQFEALDQAAMRSWPSRRESIAFAEWRLLDQDFLVIGRLRPVAEGRVEVTYELYDPYREQRLTAGTLQGTLAQWRQLAHRVSDAIYEEITGVRGVFSTKIAYVVAQESDAGMQYRLQIADADGWNEQIWYRSSQPIMSPAWSPDGKHIAFVDFQPDGSSSVKMLDLTTRNIRTLAERRGSINSAPAFSPDGRRLALTSSRAGSPNIYVLDLQSNRLQQVTTHWAIDTEPDWLDDNTLIFTSDRSGRPQIYRTDLRTQAVERLTFEGRYNARGRVGSNGERITMVYSDGGGYHIATMELDTRLVQVLTGNGSDESPSLAPNGSMVIYATKRGNNSELAWVSIDGKVESAMPSRFGDVREPAWSPYTY